MELFKLSKLVERVTHKFLTEVCKEANTKPSLALWENFLCAVNLKHTVTTFDTLAVSHNSSVGVP